MDVFAIESSCDETSIACLQDGEVHCETLSQAEQHAPYGGIVPERAARRHEDSLLLLWQKLSRFFEKADLIAATRGPGLPGSLMTGYAFARGLALSSGKPFLGINHLEAHLYALFLEREPEFPYLALLVSGGHTLLVDMPDLGRFQVLGSTRDDAAGECFDKGARMLGLHYPGGQALAELARHAEPVISFPVPDPGGFDFSFSGLKTALYLYLEKEKGAPREVVASSFQEAIIESLLQKVKRALKATGRKRLIITGGVAANERLRARAKDLPVDVFFPAVQYCTDNAAMVAVCAKYRYPISGGTPLETEILPRLSISSWRN